jgi:methionyl-tRNA synthetase
MPESGDADFSWSEFLRRNNEELVATYGNLVNRVLSFTYRNFGGVIPSPSTLAAVDHEIVETARVRMEQVGAHLYHTRFKAAIAEAFALAQDTNRYLDTKAPWREIRSDRAAAATTLWNAIRVLNVLKIVLAPFLPFSSQSVHEFLGFDGKIEDQPWDFQQAVEQVKPGNPLRQPKPLYTKLDPEVVEQEQQRLAGQAA